MSSRRLLLVHAHPDDETIDNGATMAHYSADGAQVTLLTCTLGDFGEILVPELAELASDRGDQLGGYRMLELERAMTALGVADHRFLGGAGKFHDSGMMGTIGNEHPRAFWRAATDPDVFAVAVRAAVAVIRQVRPHVVVTYDSNGGYGHPDHIMAHRVTMAAVAAAADEAVVTADEAVVTADEAQVIADENDRTADPGGAWAVPKVYWNVWPRSVRQQGLDALGAADTAFLRADSVDDFPFVVEDCAVTTVIDASARTAAKKAAMRAHATQLTVFGDFYALSNHLGQALSGVERYRLVRGQLGGVLDAHGHETDLFAGLV